GEGLALMLVLDVSGSMAEQDIVLEGKPVTRLQAATAVLKKFLAGTDQHPRGNDAIGLGTFAARPIDVCPPTTSHASVEYFLNQAEPLGTIPDNTTNIGDALALAVSLLQRSTLPGTKSIILLSDGEHTIPPELDPDALEPRQAAQLAAALGVRIHTIFLGGEPGDDIGQKQEQERALATLRAVAELTQGQANRASDADSLTRIHEQLESLEKARIDTYIYTEYQDFRFWLGLGSLLVLLLTIFLQETWLRIIP
ncbi:MAG TPA: VWA domain-containing protein, partial [Gemmatales bacterium]|nr:VWA domain-containing protein [Gemmatales bacterium]